MTRTVGASTFEPEVRAEMMPVSKSPPMVKPMMLQAFAPSVGAKAPAKGIKPPPVKEIADAMAA